MEKTYVESTVLIDWFNQIGISNPGRLFKRLIQYEVISVNRNNGNQISILHEDCYCIMKNYEKNTNDSIRPIGYLSLSELRIKWGLSRNIVYSISKLLKSTMIFMNAVFVSVDDVKEYELTKLKLRKPELKEHYVNSTLLKDWLIDKGFSPPQKMFTQIIKNGLIKGIVKKGRFYLIPYVEYQYFIDNFEVYHIFSVDKLETGWKSIKPKNTMSINEVARRWGVVYKSVYKYIWSCKLSKPIECLGTSFIPVDEVLAVEKVKEKKNKPITTESLLERLKLEINGTEAIEVNKNIFFEFSSLKLSISKASIRKKADDTSKYIKIFIEWLSLINKKRFMLSDSELEFLLMRQDIPSYAKETISKFIEYCDSVNDIKRNKKFKVFRTSKRFDSNEESIYEPEIYERYMFFVHDIDVLTERSLFSQLHANAWLFIIMHLTDVWRAPDIVTNMPDVDTEEIGISSLEWFDHNKLSIYQAQTIVNQVQLKIKNAIVSKTKQLLKFYVIPDLIIPFATAAVLSELHRRDKQHSTLLGNQLKNGLSVKKKKEIFKDFPTLVTFESRKMNRSTLTYLFYSVTEEDGPDADLALEFNRITRSHVKDSTSPEIYVRNTNKDGSLNRVSINVFRRGHFGWLFNYLVLMGSDQTQYVQGIENKTELIQSLRDRWKPHEIEAWGIFLTKKIEQKESIILKLSKLPKDIFKKIIRDILKGDLPSRTDGGQCLVYPECSYPNKKSCMDCGLFIPQFYVMTEAVVELKRLRDSITDCKYEATLQRDTKRFLYIYLLINEAYQAFGKEYVDSFIDRKDLKSLVEEISPFLQMKI
ncbi:hypothetical protein [Paenibacillus sp. LHD-38]|uniref:hypothetical protein n=1 Tax=Paenibacillus sp. LHD-38 TaxID=3072143 RepID=UPI00280F1CB0|nr:hypothetical protein [Paenibacillus sp. LHD-38]MDQ8735802.1 hypothetical protein [Paenibacillus sp. LHD-38]